MQPVHKRSSRPSRTRRALRIALATLGLGVAACAPRQDPAHPDQAPDVNYDLTAIKDQKYVGAIPQIDAYVQAQMAGKFPGCAIGIVHQGQIAYLRAYGVADFQVAANPFDDVPFTKRTVASIGSVSKVATAIAVMKLAELGHVNLDAPASTYFPHWTPGWNAITVRQLLSHRAGLARDPDPAQPGTLSPAGLDASFGAHCSQHPRYGVLEFLLTANAVPVPANIGTYAYSNIGYTVLGAIVDHVTQQPAFASTPGYERFVWSLLMDNPASALTACLDHPWRDGDIPDHAQSYTAAWAPLNVNYSGWQGPAGGWSMTIGDLARLAIALDHNQILSGASLAAMRTNPGPVAPGTDDYGLGLFLEDKAGRTAYSHGGVIEGFRTQLIVWPDHDVAVVAFANADRIGIGGIAEEVGRMWIEQGPFTPIVGGLELEETRSPLYEVSVRDFDAAQTMVLDLLRRNGEAGTASLLQERVGRQSVLGRMLVDAIQRSPRDVAGACRSFLDVLLRDGHVGGYRRR